MSASTINAGTRWVPLPPLQAAISGFDFQLVPGGFGVFGALAQLLQGGRDGGPQDLVAFGVQLEQGLAHPGRLVGPACDLGRRPLALQLGQLGAGGLLGGDEAGEIAAATTERVDALLAGLGEQVVAVGEELGRGDLVHVTHHRRDGIDMPGRHSTGRERCLRSWAGC